MSLRIITAGERLSEAQGKTTMAVFGPSGAGKTSLLKTLPPELTLCIDLEAGMRFCLRWGGAGLGRKTASPLIPSPMPPCGYFSIACLIGGIDPAVEPSSFFSEAHYQHLCQTYPDLVPMIAAKRIGLKDSITDLTRQAMA